MKKILFLTNIPTPYRIYFYNELYARGIDFEVIYLSASEKDRSWKFDKTDFKHPYSIDNGIYFMLGRFHIHVNFKVILSLIKNKPKDIVFGISWNDVDMLILVALKKLGLIKARFNFWTEANYLTIGAMQDNYLKRQIRKFVYHSSKGFQILSGEMTRITLEKWDINVFKYIYLPNTIEESVFLVEDCDINNRECNTVPIFIMPVRLIENVKGIVNFFKSIGIENIKKALFIIAGDGPDKNMIEKFVSDNDLDDYIKLLGHQNTSQMVNLYKRANIFVLPSFSDPCPLSVNEAMKMKLPLLISNRCGNHYEAVTKENGFTFDPMNPNSIKVAYENIMSNYSQLSSMGLYSYQAYLNNYELKKVVNRFKTDLEAFFEKSSTGI